MKPKVLQLLGDNEMGGIKSALNSLINSQLSEQFEFITYTLAESKPILHTLQADITILHHACSWRDLSIFWSLRRLTPRSKVVIHEHHYSAGFEQLNVSSLARFRLMLKLSYGLADIVVAVSQAQSQWMQQHQLVSQNKIITIPQCRDLTNFLSLPSKPINHPLTLAAYGRFCSQKGFDDLLKAMKLLPPLSVKLHLGGSGVQYAELQELAAGLNNLQFFGKVTDVPSFLAQCDAVVIPSRWEPWGTVCVEAKAAGKPVIVSNIDGLTEQVQNCGILVPSRDCGELAQAIASFSQQSNQTIAAWGISGRQSVSGAWEKYLHNWENLLWNLLKK